MTPEEQAHADEIDLRCLSLCIGMLERVNSVCSPFYSQSPSPVFNLI